MHSLPLRHCGTAGLLGGAIGLSRSLVVLVLGGLAVLLPLLMADAAHADVPRGSSAQVADLSAYVVRADSPLIVGAEVLSSDYAPRPAASASSGADDETDLGTKIYTAAVLTLAIAGWVAAMVWLVTARRRGAREAREELLDELRVAAEADEPLTNDVVMSESQESSRKSADDDGST